MTREILVYTLKCGCTDWCTCTPCGLGQPHQPGTTWNCDDHGKTIVTAHVEVPELYPPVENGAVVVTGSKDTFTLADDHPMRTARCGICSLPIGGEPVTILAIAALGGPGCDCGLVNSQIYLIHGSHLNMTPDQMMPYIETAMTCPNDHPWTE